MTSLAHFRATHPVRTIESNGSLWHYATSGRDTGIPVVLLPGGLGTHESLFPLIEQLERERRVIAISLSGGMPSLSACDEAVLEILRSERADRVHLAGQSFGGWLAHELAIRHPSRVKSLALMHSFSLDRGSQRRLKNASPAAAALLRALPRFLSNALLRRRVNRILLSPLSRARHPDLASWQQLVDEAVTSGELLRMAVSQATVLSQGTLNVFTGPTLIVESDDDPAVSARARRTLKEKHAHARVLTLPNTGHVSGIVATDDVARALLHFFRDHEMPPAPQGVELRQSLPDSGPQSSP